MVSNLLDRQLSRRRFLEVAALGGTAAVLAGCLPSTGSPAPSTGGTAPSTGGSASPAAGTPLKGGLLKAGLASGQATDTLDPAHVTGRSLIPFGKSWGELLMDVAPDGGLEYRIAEEIGSSKDAKTWTMKIRKGIQFHNGKEVTPEDVVATLQRHSDEQSESDAFGIMQGIESVKANGQDVVVTLKEPNADLPYLLTEFNLIIQPNGGKDDPAAGIGAGPYKVTVFEPGVRYGGEKFTDYWQGDKLGHADQIEILIINDSTARISALQNNQVNMIDQVEPKLVDLLERVSGVTVQNVSGRLCYTFNMLVDTAPFDNNDLRMALKLATDREQMVDTILRGYGSLGNDFPISEAYPLFPDGIEPRAFDPDQAKFHYQKSGHSGPILLRTSEAAFPGAVDAAQLFQQSCAKAGITIELKREPADGYWTEVWKNQPFSMAYWAGRPTQDQVYSTGFQSTGAQNDTHLSNEQFDKLLIEARAELDQDKRKNLYREMAIIVRDQGGTIAPMFSEYIDATGPGVQGFVKHPSRDMSNGYALTQCWLEA